VSQGTQNRTASRLSYAPSHSSSITDCMREQA
jgi:hypothetical protein